MITSWTRATLDAHALEPLARAAGGGWSVPVRPDHVVLSESAAGLALTALESLGIAGGRAADWSVVVADRRPHHPGFELADRLTELEERAHAAGLHFAGPGSGTCGAVYRRHAAAPGRLAISAGAPLRGAGAFGALALEVDALEAAAALAGRPVLATFDDPVRIRLVGTPTRATAAEDFAFHLLASGPAFEGRVVEIGGEALERWPMRERLRLARLLESLGARAVLFGSDEVTHAHLRSLDREADWRASVPEPEADDAWIARLEDLEPRLVSAVDRGRVRRVTEMTGTPVARVRLGPALGPEDLARFVALAGEHPPAGGVQIRLEPDGRAALETLDRDGLLERLESLGVGIDAGEGAGPAERGVTLATGIDPGTAPSAWIASPEVCAAALADGLLHDPRELPEVLDRTPPMAEAEPDGRLHSAPRDRPSAPAHEPVAVAAPARPLRGVLLHASDRLPVEQLLPWGATRVPDESDPEAFARHALADADPAFAERALRHPGGFVAAAGEMGGGSGEGERAALALAALRVRATLAGAYDERFHARLVRAGVLPLLLVEPDAFDGFAPGDVLEVPGLPEALEPGRPLAVRNLTRGIECVVRHVLDAEAIEWVERGGLAPRRAVVRVV